MTILSKYSMVNLLRCLPAMHEFPCVRLRGSRVYRMERERDTARELERKREEKNTITEKANAGSSFLWPTDWVKEHAVYKLHYTQSHCNTSLRLIPRPPGLDIQYRCLLKPTTLHYNIVLKYSQLPQFLDPETGLQALPTLFFLLGGVLAVIRFSIY